MSTPDLATELKKEGDELYEKERYQDAVDKWGDAVEHTSDPAVITVLRGNRAQAYLRLEKYSDAKLEAAEALIADLKNLKAWNRLARAHLGLGWFNEADAIFRLALRLPWLSHDSSLKTDLEAGREAVRRAKGRCQLPKEFVKEVAQEDVTRATMLKEQGNLLATSSPPDFDAAYSKFTVAIAFDPSSSAIRCNRAYCGNRLQLFDLAEGDARVAIALDRSFAIAWERLGTALAGLNNEAESKHAYEYALELLCYKPTLSPADTKLLKSVARCIYGNISEEVFDGDIQLHFYRALRLSAMFRELRRVASYYAATERGRK